MAQEWSRFVATKLTPVSRPRIGAGGRSRTAFPGLFPITPPKLFPQHFNPSASTPQAKCCASAPVAESEPISPFSPTISCTRSFERFSSGWYSIAQHLRPPPDRTAHCGSPDESLITPVGMISVMLSGDKDDPFQHRSAPLARTQTLV